MNELTQDSRSHLLADDTEMKAPVLAETTTLEALSAAFHEVVHCVEQMLFGEEKDDDGTAVVEEKTEKNEPEKSEEEKRREQLAPIVSLLEVHVKGPAKIDQVVALINAHVAQEKMLRLAIRGAEARARNHVAFVKNLKDSLQQFMLEGGYAKIMGFAHQLSLGKEQSKLIIDNEAVIPEKYWEEIPQPALRVLNKDKVLADLDAKKEVPGAYLKKEKRLNIR